MRELDSISYIIPAYNAASTIRSAIASIERTNLFNQSEIVVVDDGSSDDTWPIVSKISRENTAVRMVRHDENRGGGAARNTAVSHARNDMIFCLDADNLLRPHSAKQLLEFLSYTGSDVAAFERIGYFHGARRAHIWQFPFISLKITDYFTTHIHPGASGNYLFKRSAFEKAGGYPENAHHLDAWGFGFRLLASGARFGVLPGSSYNHRMSPNSYWQRGSASVSTEALADQLVRERYTDLPREIRSYIDTDPLWFKFVGERPLTNLEDADERTGTIIRKAHWRDSLNAVWLNHRLSREELQIE